MKASETNLQAIIGGAKQYVVPLYQRSYSWNRTEWAVLWDDLLEILNFDSQRSHFLGALVTMPAPSGPEFPIFFLIDGQQRLTTLLILLAALRDAAPDLAEEIDKTLLKNPYKKQLEHFKLIPTQGDRDAFFGIMNANLDLAHRMGEAYGFFAKRLRQLEPEQMATIFRAVVGQLSLVSITLAADDNPHLIFESLNAKGRVLTQADLIRNYFLMGASPTEQEDLYARYWQPLEQVLPDDLTEFIRHYLMKSGQVIKQGEVYLAIKDSFPLTGSSAVAEYLAEMQRNAEWYSRFLNPTEEPHPEIRKSLSDLKRLRVTVAYPFLLQLFSARHDNRLTPADVATILRALVALVLRRFVLGVSRSGLNREFPAVFQQIERRAAANNESLPVAALAVLSTKDLPSDSAFSRQLITSRLYGAGDRTEVSKLMLEDLERAAGNKELVDPENLTVEHIMPQTLTADWRTDLGSDADAIHDSLLHTLGNLTLTGYNGELSNAPFERKRAIYANSNIQLNRKLGTLDSWNEEAILARSEELAELALRVWPSFGPPRPERHTHAGNDVTGKTPSAVVIDGNRSEVSSWREVASVTLMYIWDRDEDRFFNVAEAMPQFVATSSDGLRSARQLPNGWLMETNLSANAIHRLCRQALQLAEIDAESWQLLTID